MFLIGCSSDTKPPTPEASKKIENPKPADESQRFPKANLIRTEVVGEHLLGKSFMPGGTLAHYKKAGKEYEMFVTKLPSATGAAILLPDWRKALSGAKLVPSFGGYFGEDSGRPVFVFTKREWVAGVAGLPEKDADAQARILAGAL